MACPCPGFGGGHTPALTRDPGPPFPTGPLTRFEGEFQQDSWRDLFTGPLSGPEAHLGEGGGHSPWRTRLPCSCCWPRGPRKATCMFLGHGHVRGVEKDSWTQSSRPGSVVAFTKAWSPLASGSSGPGAHYSLGLCRTGESSSGGLGRWWEDAGAGVLPEGPET